MVTIRAFSMDDIDIICAFKRESVKENFPGSNFNEALFRRIFLLSAEKNPNGVRVAEENGHVVGYIWFKVVESSVGRFGRIEHLFVKRGYRGQGIAKQLIAAAEEYFRLSGIGKVKLTVTIANDTAVSLYRKLGYVPKRYKMEKDL
ncbi:MAG: GNAT family N-acetyltransferase [Candidatus Aenigmarchaeota archaeon]|nr:GNAT family N-acetyltransferase [Candidatus Aenigmarchaeota archaeon]